MSGGCVKTGVVTNGGRRVWKNIDQIKDYKIIDAAILVVPLFTNTGSTIARSFGQFFQLFIHPAIFSATTAHLAIALNLEKDLYTIIEFGQYYTENSDIKNIGIFASSNNYNSSQDPRKANSRNCYYYYINKDGARLEIIFKALFTIFDKIHYLSKIKYNFKNEKKRNLFYCEAIMACNHYNIDYDEYIKKRMELPSITNFHIIECEVNNKITIGELCNYFKGKKWEAKDYNVVNHNCQTFAAEVIKILKIVRIHDYDKVRSREKLIFPNCIISALWDNEKLSAVNTIGRIPIIGLVYDNLSRPFRKFPMLEDK